MIATPSSLTLKNGQLVCTSLCSKDDVKTAPIEDIGVVIVENQQAALSVPLINALSDNNVALIFCDGRSMPNSVLLSLNANTTQGEMLKYQVSSSESLKNRLWKQTVERKIRNQAALLDKFDKDGNLLRPFYSNVKSGDVDNREGAAARVYWHELFGRGFSRERQGDAPNNMLNYGYSILRSAVCRALLGSGINPSFGLFHKSKYNAFPLADDIMEPYRPFVDEIVYGVFSNGETELTQEVKSYLVGVLSADTRFDDCRRPLEIGLSVTTASLGRCYKGEEKSIVYPKLE